MDTPIIWFALRAAIHEFKRVRWQYGKEGHGFEDIAEIPDEPDDEHISKEQGGIFHRRGKIVYHAYHYHFTKKEFPSVASAIRYMKHVDLYVWD